MKYALLTGASLILFGAILGCLATDAYLTSKYDLSPDPQPEGLPL